MGALEPKSLRRPDRSVSSLATFAQVRPTDALEGLGPAAGLPDDKAPGGAETPAAEILP